MKVRFDRSTPPVRVLLVGVLLAVGAASTLAQVVAEDVGDGIVRYHPDAQARDGALVSLALVEPLAARGHAPEDFPVAAAFGFDGERYVARIDVEAGTSLYGTGQAAGPLLRNGRVVEAWNTDAYGYGADAPSLYTSHPWVLAVRADGSAFGVLADTTHRAEVDLTDGITFRVPGHAFPLIVIDRASPQDVMEALGDLTGTITMPPKWALGYHQCRYSYYPDARVRAVADGFRSRRIPADVIWMDIDYMDSFRVFTFDGEHFPDPEGLNDWLDGRGFSNVWMINPGVKKDPGFFVYDAGVARDVWVKDASGQTYVGDVWPGACVFPDFMNADVRAWWAGLYADFMARGIDGVWNDMNEPAVFNVASKTMPEDNRHRADPELGGPGTHARYHNVYGMQMVRATREGVMAANPDRRPFVLSRANFIGGHRYGATWTGDNTASWEHLDFSIAMTLNLGLSGQPFAGPDIGGFVDDGTPEMFARWIGFGALFPFSRGHTGKGNIDKEPWAFGAEVEATSRRALERRYRLLPHLYTLFRESSLTGMPIARPTFFADPADPALRSEDDSFLLGSGLLVVANPMPSRDRASVLPRPVGGVAWAEFDFPGFDGGRDGDDPDLPRLFVRPGAIIPAGPVKQYVMEPVEDDYLELIACLDASGRAEGELYEDAGDGWAYLEGAYLHTTWRLRKTGRNYTLRILESAGDQPRPDRRVVVRVLKPDGGEFVFEGRSGETITARD